MKNVIIFFLLSFFSFGLETAKSKSHLLNLDTTVYKVKTKNHNTRPVPLENSEKVAPSFRKVDILSNWHLIKGWFPDKNLEFTNTNKKKDVFIFKKNGTMLFIPRQETFYCPVGEFTMKDGKWSIEVDYLTLELRGLKIADYWYWWKIKYKIKELTKDNLKLEVIKIIKNKEIEPTLKWEDLLKLNDTMDTIKY